MADELRYDAGRSAFAQFRAAGAVDERFEPARLQAALRAILGPFEDVRTDDQLLAVWTGDLDRWLPDGWRRSRLPGVPGGWGADVDVVSLDVVTFRNAQPAEVVVRAALRVRRWPRMPGLGALIRVLFHADHVLWLTLVDPGDGWTLSRVDFDNAGEFHLGAETVPEPVRDPAIGDAQQQLLDLSLAAGRFAPDVIEASVRSVIRAWRQMLIGHEDAYEELAALADHEVARYAREAYQPVQLDAIEVVAIVPEPRPELFLRIRALVQVRDGTREKDLWWRLVLDDDLAQHWRLVDAYAAPELRALRGEKRA